MPAGAVAVRVTPAAEARLRAGFPWVREWDLRSVSRDAPPGATAVVFDRRKRLLAVGLWDPTSSIRVRVLEAGRSATLDEAFLRRRVGEAVARRLPLAAAGHTGYRLAHGEHDGLPGVVLDRYDETVVVQLDTVAWLPHLEGLADVVATEAGARAVVLRTARRLQSGRDGEVLRGEVGDAIPFRENGLTLIADVRRGNKTGYFFDQRDNRARLAERCAGARVLDVCSSTGGFSVNAARGGASAVTSVDVSAPALAFARRNMAANAACPHETIEGDAFCVLEALGKDGARFDAVVLDPPAFARRTAQVDGALAAYAALTRLGLGVLADGGTLVFACCSRPIGEDAFVGAVTDAARVAGRPLEIEAVTGQPDDHPVRFDEGRYLKCLFARARS